MLILATYLRGASPAEWRPNRGLLVFSVLEIGRPAMPGRRLRQSRRAIIWRGDLQIAISTAGQSPSLAQNLRQQLEKQFGPGYAAWVAELGETRRLIRASDLDRERKLELLHSLASREAVEAALEQIPALAAK